jgi:hypothetical protein
MLQRLPLLLKRRLVSFGGVSHPVWTDSRDQLVSSSGCSTNLLMEEVFSAVVR